MSFHGDGCDFPLFFHLVNDKANYGEVKPTGGRIEMKCQVNSVFEFNMKLELIEINGDGVSSGIFRHFPSPTNSLKREGIL